MPFDYSFGRQEIHKPIDNEEKGLEPFHTSARSGLSLYYQNSSVGDRLNFKERVPAKEKHFSQNTSKRSFVDGSKFISDVLKVKKGKDYYKKKTIEYKSGHKGHGSKRSSIGSIEEFDD
jgi:hypothetical protein